MTISDIKFDINRDSLNIEIPCSIAETPSMSQFKVEIISSKGSIIRPVLDIYNSNDGAQDVGLIYFDVSTKSVSDELNVKIKRELTPCETDLNELLSKATPLTKKNFIDLYKKYPENNGLLNFSNPTCQVLSNNVEPVNSCLEADYTVDFSSEDVSNFDNANLDAELTFCKSYFNIENMIHDSKFSLKSGMLMYFNSEESTIMNATVVEKCYSYENSRPSSTQLVNVISDMKLGDLNLSGALSEPNIQTNDLGNGITETIKELRISYDLPLIYAISGTGEIVYAKDYNEKCIVENGEKKYTICQKIGIGIPTKFTEGSDNKMVFSYKFKDKTQNADCEYNIEREIVKCDESNKNCKLNLEFRPITSNSESAFVNKNGEKRVSGQNWCTPIKNRVIDERNDSSGKKGNEPLYTIELTTDKIKDIRKYNKENSYNTPLYCDMGGLCESSFLKEKFPDLQRAQNLTWENEFNNILYGDANYDGYINIYDVFAIQRYAVGYSFETNCDAFSEELSDVNTDGIIDETDAELIQKYIAKFSDTGKVGEKYTK